MLDHDNQRRAEATGHPCLTRVVLVVWLSVIAGGVGYLAGATREHPVSRLPVDATAALEYLVSSDSFSEIAQARSVLDGLANRYLLQARMLIARETLAGRDTGKEGSVHPERPCLAAIRVLEEAAAELDGTSHELQLLPTLLSALKRERLYGRWIEAYLSALYRHPNHRVVADQAAEALVLARTIGREAEVIAALRHVSAIPSRFVSGWPIERRLTGMAPEFQHTAVAHEQRVAPPQS